MCGSGRVGVGHLQGGALRRFKRQFHGRADNPHHGLDHVLDRRGWTSHGRCRRRSGTRALRCRRCRNRPNLGKELGRGRVSRVHFLHGTAEREHRVRQISLVPDVDSVSVVVHVDERELVLLHQCVRRLRLGLQVDLERALLEEAGHAIAGPITARVHARQDDPQVVDVAWRDTGRQGRPAQQRQQRGRRTRRNSRREARSRQKRIGASRSDASQKRQQKRLSCLVFSLSPHQRPSLTSPLPRHTGMY
jgi:hypothetical protein